MLAPEKKGHKLLKDIIFEHGDQQKFNVGLYHSYQDILAHLKGLAEKHPYLVKFGSIGQSFEGRELAYVKAKIYLFHFQNSLKSKAEIIARLQSRKVEKRCSIHRCRYIQKLDILIIYQSKYLYMYSYSHN